MTADSLFRRLIHERLLVVSGPVCLNIGLINLRVPGLDSRWSNSHCVWVNSAGVAVVQRWDTKARGMWATVKENIETEDEVVEVLVELTT